MSRRHKPIIGPVIDVKKVGENLQREHIKERTALTAMSDIGGAFDSLPTQLEESTPEIEAELAKQRAKFNL